MSVFVRDSFGEESDDSLRNSNSEMEAVEDSETLFSSPESALQDGCPKSSTTTFNKRPMATRRLFQENESEHQNQIRPVSQLSDLSNRVAPARQSNSELGNISSTSSNTQELILQELRKTNARLDMFTGRLESLEGRLTSVETTTLSMTPSSSSGVDNSGEKGKRKVPARVSVCCPCIYFQYLVWL